MRFPKYFKCDKQKEKEYKNNENYLSKGIIENICYHTCAVPCGLLGEDKYIIEIYYSNYNIRPELLEFDTKEEQLETVSQLKEKMKYDRK